MFIPDVAYSNNYITSHVWSSMRHNQITTRNGRVNNDTDVRQKRFVFIKKYEYFFSYG